MAVPAYSILRPLLFRLDAETSHGAGIAALRAVQAMPALARRLAASYRFASPALAQRLLGREFANPVGLAAGFDKDAVAIGALAALGFGFVEAGTVTPRPQEGNPRPRLFRFPAQRSLQNALGFNSAGLAAVAANLTAARPYPLPVGVNLGKNRQTPPAAALDDYATLIRGLGTHADYLAINLSSPNTPGLRDLQNEAFVREVLALGATLSDRPLLVKLSPDLGPAAAADLAAAAVDAGAAGIIATNTTTDYALLAGARPEGGLSGEVLRERSFGVLAAIGRRLRGRALLVSAGGVDSGAEAYRRIRAGASLVQVYTALVYQGPALARRINEELVALLARDGVKHIADAVGGDLA
jgi:dihydroorotate dehydrogenase